MFNKYMIELERISDLHNQIKYLYVYMFICIL